MNLDRLATGIIAIHHMMGRCKQNMEHHKFILENRNRLGLDIRDVTDKIAADTFNLESLEAVYEASRKVMLELTSETSIAVAQ
jgi:hypothetical protein